MDSNCTVPLNIGSEEMVTINELAEMAIAQSNKTLKIHNIQGDEFKEKYGFDCPVGVRGRNSDNAKYQEMIGWSVSKPLKEGIEETYPWILSELMTQS